MTNLNLAHLNDQFDQQSPADILRWAWETFAPDIAASSSFQTQSLPLLHLISQICPEMPVIFLNTGFHFSETLSYRDELQALLNLNIVIARPAVEKSDLMIRYGEGLYRRDPDLCCYINKVEPMQRAKTGLRAWISGVRHDQTEYRSGLRVLEAPSEGPLKIHPLLNWTKKEVWAYIDQYQLPVHPLLALGYMSVGCAPCTRPIHAGENERDGRWAGLDKVECGLHLNLNHSISGQ
jgi:phosphoadenosine phosphosulfate reductase